MPASNNDVTDTSNTPDDTKISNITSDSSESASPSPAPDEGFFEYFLPGGTTLTSGLYFNGSNEFYIDSMNEFETMYGTVTVLSGYSESLACIIDNCFFNYIDVL